jgi:hypothetical protein
MDKYRYIEVFYRRYIDISIYFFCPILFSLEPRSQLSSGRLPQHPAKILYAPPRSPLGPAAPPDCRVRSGPYNPRVAPCEVQELGKPPVAGDNKCRLSTEFCVLLSPVPFSDLDNRSLFVAGLLGRSF